MYQVAAPGYKIYYSVRLNSVKITITINQRVNLSLNNVDNVTFLQKCYIINIYLALKLSMINYIFSISMHDLKHN